MCQGAPHKYSPLTNHSLDVRDGSFAEQQIHEDMKLKSYDKKSKLSCIFTLHNHSRCCHVSFVFLLWPLNYFTNILTIIF